jgi:hypothetical protein
MLPLFGFLPMQQLLSGERALKYTGFKLIAECTAGTFDEAKALELSYTRLSKALLKRSTSERVPGQEAPPHRNMCKRIYLS